MKINPKNIVNIRHKFGEKNYITVILIAIVVFSLVAVVLYARKDGGTKPTDNNDESVSTRISNVEIASTLDSSLKEQFSENGVVDVDSAKSVAYIRFNEGEYTKALETLNWIIENSAEESIDYGVYQLLGLAYKRTGDNNNANKYFDKAVILLESSTDIPEKKAALELIEKERP